MRQEPQLYIQTRQVWTHPTYLCKPGQRKLSQQQYPTVGHKAINPFTAEFEHSIQRKEWEWASDGPARQLFSLITTDDWVLNMVQGCQTESLQQPHYHRLPPCTSPGDSNHIGGGEKAQEKGITPIQWN